MPRFELVDAANNVIETHTFTERPADPAGKPYRWVEDKTGGGNPHRFHSATSAVQYTATEKQIVWTKGTIDAGRIKEVCRAQIVARVNDTAQRNITALSLRKAVELINATGPVLASLAAGKPTDLADYNATSDALVSVATAAMGVQDWISAMQAESRAAILEAREPVWPAWNADWDALVALV